jgi:mono/diheme cytochrome c family protein
MKKTALITIVCLLLVPMAGFADEALYKAKCVACHGVDGKKSAKVDLTSAVVQDKTDEVLVKFLTSNAIHKAKVATPEQAKSVVTYVRSLKK